MLYENVFSLKLTFAKHFIRVIIFYACGSKVKNYLQKLQLLQFLQVESGFGFIKISDVQLIYWLPCYF